jgi:hypothetical protein
MSAKVVSAFSVTDSLRFAHEALSRPSAQAHIERPVPLGYVVAEFVLPLELCKPFNRVGRAGTASAGRMLGAMKSAAYNLMRVQLGGRLPNAPLPGRPHVLCCRFSSAETDVDSGWSKNPVDRLRVGRNGLGVIVDDKPKCTRVSTWWEPGLRGAGFVFVQVRTGEAAK